MLIQALADGVAIGGLGECAAGEDCGERAALSEAAAGSSAVDVILATSSSVDGSSQAERARGPLT